MHTMFEWLSLWKSNSDWRKIWAEVGDFERFWLKPTFRWPELEADWSEHYWRREGDERGVGLVINGWGMWSARVHRINGVGYDEITRYPDPFTASSSKGLHHLWGNGWLSWKVIFICAHPKRVEGQRQRRSRSTDRRSPTDSVYASELRISLGQCK